MFINLHIIKARHSRLCAYRDHRTTMTQKRFHLVRFTANNPNKSLQFFYTKKKRIGQHGKQIRHTYA